MRAAIYVRISRDRVGAGLGVDRQEADCRDLAAHLGYKVVEIYRDNDLSAYSGKPRPAYRKLVADLAAGGVDVVLCWHTDRLHRSPTELEAYIAACDLRGVPTNTVKAGALDLATPSGRLVARQLGAVARYEVEHQIERQQAAKRQAAAAGKWGGGRRPYGYEPDGVTVRPAEAKVVAQVTDAILIGASLRAECARLNEDKIVTSTGRAWQATELRRMIMRARNAGLREHRGAVIGKAEWPPLVSEEKWRAATSILSDPARRTSFSRARRWLLSNLAKCGVCSSPLRVTLLEASRSAVPSYSCSAQRCVVRNALELEKMIEGVMVERLKRKDAMNLLRAAAPGVDLVAVRAERVAIEKRMDSLADDLDLDERTLARRTKALKAKLAELLDQQESAGRGSVFAGVVDAPDVAKAWAALHLDRKRAIIAELAQVVVHRTRKGRPPGWQRGQSYFDPSTIQVIPKR